MPELHKLTPTLGVLQDRGYKVALITDGRMSGASGKVPAAIHVSPEALPDGPAGAGARRRRRSGSMRADGTLEAVGVDLALAPAGQLAAAAGRHRARAVRADAAARRRGRSGRLGDACSDGSGAGMRQIAVADVGGTHARFALAEIEGGRVVVARRAGHAQDRRACAASSSPGRSSAAAPASTLPNELAIAFAGPVGGEVLKLTNNPWVIRPGADQGAARASTASPSSTISARSRYAVAHAAATSDFQPFVRSRSAAAERRRDHRSSVPAPASASPRCFASGRPLRGDRDRGRPHRLRAARQPRGQDPRRSCARTSAASRSSGSRRAGACGTSTRRSARSRGAT